MTRWLVTVNSRSYAPDSLVPCDSRIGVWAVCWAARKDKRTYRVALVQRSRGAAWWRARVAAFDARMHTGFLPPGGTP